jgi:hypothetical protein
MNNTESAPVKPPKRLTRKFLEDCTHEVIDQDICVYNNVGGEIRLTFGVELKGLGWYYLDHPDINVPLKRLRRREATE